MNFVLRNIPHFFLFIALFLGGSFLTVESQAAPKNRQVLIVQSGFEGYPWTDSQNKGIQDVFSLDHKPTDFFFEYIDTKRNYGKSYLKDLQKFWKTKYHNQQIDLIITCDNQAYEFILKNRSTLFQDIPLVFAGMNKFKPAVLRGKSLTTGVAEDNDLRATVDIALRLHPGTKKLVFIIPGAQPYRLQWVENLPLRYKEQIEQIVITARELDEIDRQLDTLGPNLVAVLLGSIVVQHGTYISFKTFVAHLATNRSLPLYTIWDGTLGQGIVGGKLIRGELQGRKAAELALQVLAGTPIADLPIVEKSPAQYMFDWQQLERFNIDPCDLPSEAIIMNSPLSFYAENRRVVQVTLTGIFLLVLLIVCLMVAIINLKKAQKKILLSREILEQMPEAIILTNMDGKIEMWLGRAEDIFCYSESECLGRSLNFIQPAGVQLSITEQIDRGIEKSGRFLGAISCLKKGGTLIPIEVTATRVFSSAGVALGTISILQDITEREQAKESLRASEVRFRKMVAKSPMPTMLTNRNYDIIFVNDKFTELFGYRLEDVETGKKWWKTAYPDAHYRRRVENGWRAAVKNICTGGVDMAMQEWDLTVKDGSVRRCEFYMAPIEELSLVVVNDISQRIHEASEKNKLELRLQQAQKMEAIGTLAGGIAHDFNNILAVILGYAELAKDETPAHSTLSEDLDQVIEGGNRAKELVKQILAFSRQERVERLPLQVQTLLKETMKMLKPSLPSTLEIQIKIDPHCGFVLADPTQVHQIIMNLCTNANHAMEKSGGLLKIELKRIFVAEDEEYLTLKSGDYVVLLVADTGEGIAPCNMGKIFEPYFTTKPIGRGTGMGLATIHGIIREYGGLIDVVSEPGEGTTFRVFFPMISTLETGVASTVCEIPQGRGRILLVDDEELLLVVVKKILQGLGYKVTTKSSSVEALVTFKERPDAFDAVITDQTMPEMVGSDLAQEILKIRTDIPIILCTGYSDQLDAEGVRSLGIREFALKPLTKTTLAHLLSRILGDSQGWVMADDLLQPKVF